MVRKRMVSTVMSLMMAAAVLTTVPVTNNVKAADKEVTSGSYTYVNEDATATQAPEIAVQLVDKKGNATDTNHVGKVSMTKKEVGEAYEDTYTFSVSEGGAYTVKLTEKK